MDTREGGARSKLAAQILNRFMAYYRHGVEGGHFEEYKRRSVLIGRDVDVILHGESKKAHVLGLSDNCNLLVKYEDGTEDALSFGEVSIRSN